MTTATVEAGGVALAVEEDGTGAPVVLVHGTAADRTVWRETIDSLGGRVRAISYDRRAYGDSGAPEPYGGTTIGEQADDLAELIEALGAAPAVLCGHGLGATICLDVLTRHRALARAAVLIEPPLLWLSPIGTETMSDIRDAIETGARDGGAAGAVDAYLTQTSGSRVLELMGPERAAAARGAARAFAADFAATAGWSTARRELRALDVPVRLVAGRPGRVPSDVTRALAELLPDARVRELDTGHHPPLEDPHAVAAEILDLTV